MRNQPSNQHKSRDAPQYCGASLHTPRPLDGRGAGGEGYCWIGFCTAGPEIFSSTGCIFEPVALPPVLSLAIKSLR